jgi:thioredoxin-dependent peroxiredoxin
MLFGLSGRPEVLQGEAAPLFTLPDQFGVPFSLEAALNTSAVVLFFYPKDDTPHCLAEACGFRDNLKAFQDAGALVVGISSDNQSSHGRFAEKHQLTFPLLADEQGEVRRLYGVPMTLGILPGRVTYVIHRDGRILNRIVSQFRPLDHIDQALKCLLEHPLHGTSTV